MLDIIICEDNKLMINEIVENIDKCSMQIENDIKFNILRFNGFCEKLNEVINDKKEKIYILDIALEGEESGLFIAKRIRNVDSKSKIIFLTSYEEKQEMVLKNYLEVFAFISKGMDSGKEFRKAFLASINRIFKTEENYRIIVSDEDYTYPIELENIIYIKTSNNPRYLDVCTILGMKKYKSTIKDVKNILNENFVKVDSGMIVNKKFIYKVKLIGDAEIYLNNKERITSISKSGKKELRSHGY